MSDSKKKKKIRWEFFFCLDTLLWKRKRFVFFFSLCEMIDENYGELKNEW